MSHWMPYVVAAPLFTAFLLSLAVTAVSLAGDARQPAPRRLD